MGEAADGMRAALVTGGSRGIGAEIARQLVEAGHRVLITGRDEARLRAAADRLGVLHITSDVSVQGSAERVVEEAIDRLGQLDLLVNNAGVSGSGGPLLQQSAEEWWAVLRTNLYGPMAFMRGALPEMVARGSGLVINIGSYGAVRPTPGASSYSSSKAALARLTDSVAAEVRGTGVAVLCVSPGLVDTDMTRGIGVFDDLPAEMWDPIGRIGELVCALVDHPHLDKLSGRFLHVRDDIDEIVTHSEQVATEGLYQLGLARLEGRVG